MQIDRSNYEIWLIDWLDENLSDIQIEQLQLFLRDNPDLKEEFEELTTFRLNPSERSFTNKSRLQKSPSDLSETQFEYLSVAYLENDISADQQAELKEKILKEKTAKDSPLKAYELAEAGVSGLNKLLDCEMDEKKDANGVLKSVYFSSKIIKFNAPIKKSEPLP